MIYLIGGPPRCGKSTVAAIVSRQAGACWLPGEFLEAIVSQYVSSDDKEFMFGKNRLRKLYQQDNDAVFSRYSTDELLHAYLMQATTIQPAVESLVRRAVAAQRSLVIEGFQLEPSLMYKLEQAHGLHQVRALLLYRERLDDIVRCCRASTDPDDWLLRGTRWSGTIWRAADLIRAYGRHLIDQAAMVSMECHCMDGDFQDQADRAAARLVRGSE